MSVPRMFAVLAAAVCILSLLPFAGAMTVTFDPLSTASASSASAMLASVNDNYPISEEQAKDSVRVFMGNLTLDPRITGTGSLEIGNYYELDAGQDSFGVNQNSGIVEFAHFGENASTSDKLSLTRDQAYAKATAYASAKYDGFSDKNWKLVIDQVSDGGSYVRNATTGDYEWVPTKAYDFVLREEKDHVLLPSLVYIEINPSTGAVVDYWGVDRILTVASLKSATSLSDAVKSATDYTYSEFAVTSSEGYLAVVTRSQNVENLAWVIKLTGSYRWDPDYTYTYIVIVDANDGSVLGTRWDSIWPESRLNNYF
jgi:hypothetical protein